jgi:hypothetical protein
VPSSTVEVSPLTVKKALVTRGVDCGGHSSLCNGSSCLPLF